MTAMRGGEQACDLLEVDARSADVVLQSQVVSVAALRQQALFDHHVRDDLLGDGIVFGCAVRVL
jgi:hypothetical protein